MKKYSVTVSQSKCAKLFKQKSFCVKMGTRAELISIDRLKDTSIPVTVAVPPARGRPPARARPPLETNLRSTNDLHWRIKRGGKGALPPPPLKLVKV